MEVEVKRKVKVTTLQIHTKVTDMFCACLLDELGVEVGGQEEGYVPGFMPGEHFGDYIILDIDLETGQIKNWVKPTDDQLNQFIGNDN